jgi:hypothetical protein
MLNPGTDLAAGTWVSGTNRFICSSERKTYLNGTSATSTANPLTGATGFALGNAVFGSPVTGIYSRAVYDPSLTGCKP